LPRRPLAIAALTAALAFALALAWLATRAGRACVDGPAGTSLCALSDSARPTADGDLDLDSPDLDLSRGPLRLHAARNETISFQIALRAGSLRQGAAKIALSDLEGPSGARLAARDHARRFLAHFVQVDPGGHTWGSPTRVLPWPDAYPDALVPFEAPCDPATTLIDEVPLPGPHGDNQLIWFDLYIPADQPPGEYTGAVTVEVDHRSKELPVALTIWPAALPHATSVDAVAELYQSYRAEGIDGGLWDPAWQRMARCYQQLAHQHRAVFIERLPRPPGPAPDNPEPDPQAWDDFDAAYAGALSGELFTPAQGYLGPGLNTPVSAWRTPWPQPWSEHLDGPLTDAELDRLRAQARAFEQHALDRGWTRTRLFAYLFDEVDGATDEGANAASANKPYIAMAHAQMARVQRALDEGAPTLPIDLLWTSHSDPAAWADDPALDLRGIIRLWAPNAAAADPAFLRDRADSGERAWFYHAGHPHLGAHVINAHGTELRSWGLMAARYRLQGMFIWAADLGDPDEPYRWPSYKREDDRFGNGTLVYPGAKLDQIGHRPAPGPIPSMRLKAWRRGLQDAELALLARQNGHDDTVNKLLQKHIPAGLGEARAGDDAAWPSDHAAWEALRLELLRLASAPSR
jgi:hypothetical protein